MCDRLVSRCNERHTCRSGRGAIDVRLTFETSVAAGHHRRVAGLAARPERPCTPAGRFRARCHCWLAQQCVRQLTHNRNVPPAPTAGAPRRVPIEHGLTRRPLTDERANFEPAFHQLPANFHASLARTRRNVVRSNQKPARSRRSRFRLRTGTHACGSGARIPKARNTNTKQGARDLFFLHSLPPTPPSRSRPPPQDRESQIRTAYGRYQTHAETRP